jgi:hypothetical protein
MQEQRSGPAPVGARQPGKDMAPSWALEVCRNRSDSLARDRARSAFLARGSLDRRACKQPPIAGRRGTAYPDGSGGAGALLAENAQEGICVGRSSRLQIARRPKRSAVAPRGYRVLSRRASRRGAFASRLTGESCAAFCERGGRPPKRRAHQGTPGMKVGESI